MTYAPRIAKALEQATRPALVWLEFQDCTGNSESALRASHPTFADIVLDLLSWNYHETVMAPSGKAAEKSLHDTVTQQQGQYPGDCRRLYPAGREWCLLHDRSIRQWYPAPGMRGRAMPRDSVAPMKPR